MKKNIYTNDEVLEDDIPILQKKENTINIKNIGSESVLINHENKSIEIPTMQYIRKLEKQIQDIKLKQASLESKISRSNNVVNRLSKLVEKVSNYFNIK